MQLSELIAHIPPYHIAAAMEIDKSKIGEDTVTPTPTLIKTYIFTHRWRCLIGCLVLSNRLHFLCHIPRAMVEHLAKEAQPWDIYLGCLTSSVTWLT